MDSTARGGANVIVLRRDRRPPRQVAEEGLIEVAALAHETERDTRAACLLQRQALGRIVATSWQGPVEPRDVRDLVRGLQVLERQVVRLAAIEQEARALNRVVPDACSTGPAVRGAHAA